MNYVSKALEVLKENAAWMPKILGGVVCVGGIAAEHSQGVYNPAPWIATGSYLWALGDAIDGWRIYANENLNHLGTRVKLAGAAMRVAGAVLLGYNAGQIGSVPGYESLDLIPPIAAGGGLNATGIGLDSAGQRINESLYPRYQAAAKFREVGRKLDSSKELDESPEQLDDYNQTADGLIQGLDY